MKTLAGSFPVDLSMRYRVFGFLCSFYFYTSEVYEGKYIGVENPYLTFFDWTENFPVGYSDLLNTEMTID